MYYGRGLCPPTPLTLKAILAQQASGHKTVSASQRYNLVTEEEMKGMKWLEEKGENSGMIDTYMDTKIN